MMSVSTGHELTVAHRRQPPSPLVIVAAITALLCIAVGALVIGEFAPGNADTSIVTGFVLGTVAPTVVSLLALLRGDHAAQVGQANAERLEVATGQIAEVAENVNGHLTRHDDLAEKITTTADSLARLATANTPVARAATERTRTTDTDTTGGDVTSPGLDAPPLAPEQT